MIPGRNKVRWRIKDMTELHPLLQDFYEEIEPKKRHNHLKEYLEAAGGAKSFDRLPVPDMMFQLREIRAQKAALRQAAGP